MDNSNIFKKVMWYSYQGVENWIPVEIDKVKEFAETNKEGKKIQDLASAYTPPEVIKPISYDYENVVGQDSLTRLDDKNKRKKRRKSKPKTEGNIEVKSIKSEATPRQLNRKNTDRNKEHNVSKTVNEEIPKSVNENRPKRKYNNRNRNRNRTSEGK